MSPLRTLSGTEASQSAIVLPPFLPRRRRAFPAPVARRGPVSLLQVLAPGARRLERPALAATHGTGRDEHRVARVNTAHVEDEVFAARQGVQDARAHRLAVRQPEERLRRRDAERERRRAEVVEEEAARLLVAPARKPLDALDGAQADARLLADRRVVVY